MLVHYRLHMGCTTFPEHPMKSSPFYREETEARKVMKLGIKVTTQNGWGRAVSSFVLCLSF